MTERVGILGGTFDPMHLGHLAAADLARDALGLDRVLIIPSLTPLHRPSHPVASPYHRFAMAALAVADRPDFCVSDIELRRLSSSYTSETLAYLHAHGFEPGRLFFIVGADAFADVASWHDYPAILQGCHYAVVTRPGFSHAHVQARLPDLVRYMTPARDRLDGDGALPSILLVPGATPDISASRIRAIMASSGTAATMLPSRVEEHARKHGLYARDRHDDQVPMARSISRDPNEQD